VAGTRIASVSGLRGIVGHGLDPASAVEFAAAYAAGCGPGAILVGHDGRASAPMFLHAVVAGVLATGRDAMIVGPVATPTLGRLVRERGAAGAIQISASHNPPEYNGLKFFQVEGMVLSPEQGRAVLVRLGRRDFGWAPWNALGKAHTLHNPDAEHLEAVLKVVDVPAIRARKFGVVLDSCHGAGGRLGAALLAALGCHATVIGDAPDGHYDHPPEPTEANLRDLARLIPKEGAHVGFAQDPDADRLAVVDEHGRYIGEELTLALAVRHRLESATGPVVCNLSTSRVIDDVAGRFGCPVHRTPVGEIHVVTAMKEHDAILGGEGNGGVIEPRVGFVRDSFVGMAMILDLMARTGQPLSALVAELPRYAMIKDKFPVAADGPPPDELFEEVARAHPEAKADRRDGLRLDWPDRWAHVRASNTEPIVRVITEAPTQDEARALADRVGAFITPKG
jgi:phosphomannomutase